MTARAVRALRRDRGFAGMASLTLALGIGLSTAVFTVAQALLVRDLPVRDQDGIVVLWGETPDRSFADFPLSYDQGRDFRASARSLESAAFVAYYGAWPTAIRDGDAISRLREAQVSGFGGVMRRGLAIALVGAAVGLVASVAGNRLLVALLYDLSPTDIPTYLTVLGVLITLSASAIAVPARSSTRVDPALALRAE